MISTSAFVRNLLMSRFRSWAISIPESFAEGFSVRSPREIHGITYIDQLYIETFTLS